MQPNRRRLFQRLREQSVHLPRALRLIAASSGALLPLWLGLLVVAGLLPALCVYLTRAVVDVLAAVVGGGDDWQPLLMPAVVLGVVLLAGEVASALRRWLSGLQAERVGDHLAEKIQRQALGVPLEHYDDAAFYDRLHRARSHAQQHPSALLESGGSLLQNALTLLAMAAVLLPFGWWWPPVLVASAAPGVVAALWVRFEDYSWRRRTTAERRRVWYLDQLMSTRESAGELRVLELGPHLRQEYRCLRQQLREQRQRLVGRRVLLEMAAVTIALLAAAGVLVVMFQRLRRGEATLGELALFAQAFYQGQKMMRSLLENAGDLYGHLFDLADFFAFLDLDIEAGPRAQASSHDELQEVSFDQAPAVHCVNVTYRYANASSPALDGLDLKLEGGLLHAIVGPNGAGKSTLIKLLGALLTPQEGAVRIGGVELAAVEPVALRRQIAVMFQEPVRFQASAFENIRFGDMAKDPDFEVVSRAAEQAGVDDLIAGFEAGFETPLGAWFRGGRELSTGQWQRLALARACLRQAPLWLLDEPTSAVDMWSEKAFFEGLRPLMKGRTVILITHRPSAARHADRIHVLESGRLSESGSPTELLKNAGRYAEMWHERD